MTNLFSDYSRAALQRRAVADPVAGFLLGVGQLRGWWGPRSRRKARVMLRQAARAGYDVAGLVERLWLCTPPKGEVLREALVEEKPPSALERLTGLAERGDPCAQWVLGGLLLPMRVPHG